MQTMHLFAGAGGGLLADLIIGHKPIIAVEWEPYACQVLRERAEEGWFPDLQVWEGDVRLFDPSEHKSRVDCIHAGFPCQDISTAGSQAGVGEGTRSGLYKEVLRIADEVRPEYIFLENVAAIVTGADGEWLRTILGDLAERGFDAVWCCLSAAEVGAPHKRDRWWLLAYPSGNREGEFWDGRTDDNEHRVSSKEEQRWNNIEHGFRGNGENVADTKRIGQSRSGQRIDTSNQAQDRERQASNAVNERFGAERQAESSLGMLADDVADYMVRWSDVEAQVGRVTDETKNRADKLKALGNGQVSLQAAVAFSILWQMMQNLDLNQGTNNQ